MTSPTLSARLAEAFELARMLHARQLRKGSGTPYLAHLMGVAALVLEDGGSEDEAIAALLHDAAEDQGGRQRLEEIRGRFGEKVASIVEACSDSLESPKPPWRGRKEQYIAHIRDERDPAVLRVALADKVYNARAILSDYRTLGEDLWRRFAPDSDQPWYYRSLVDAFRETPFSSPMLAEFERTVAELERLRR